MNPSKIFADERMRGCCVYCGGNPETKEHAPPKVFLDEPYPSNLGVVAACQKCNQGYALDEEYLACFIECVVCGSVEPDSMRRAKIAKALKQPKLAARILRAKSIVNGEMLWTVEIDRVSRILQKLAISHIDYELSLQPAGEVFVKFFPLHCLSVEDQTLFFEDKTSPVQSWPEVGSRAFINVSKGDFEQTGFERWRCVQPERYMYFVSQAGGGLVRMLIGGYLACEVYWEV